MVTTEKQQWSEIHVRGTICHLTSKIKVSKTNDLTIGEKSMILQVTTTYCSSIFGCIRNFSSLMTRISYMVHIEKQSPKHHNNYILLDQSKKLVLSRELKSLKLRSLRINYTFRKNQEKKWQLWRFLISSTRK